MPVSAFDDTLAALVRDMFEAMYAAPGRGLAAPQVGVGLRVFVVDTDWMGTDPAPMIFVNPAVINRAKTEAVGGETCLSIPGKTFDVSRPLWVEMAWQDLDGAAHKGRFEGVQAICICHELDHLDGILVTQRGMLQ